MVFAPRSQAARMNAAKKAYGFMRNIHHGVSRAKVLLNWYTSKRAGDAIKVTSSSPIHPDAAPPEEDAGLRRQTDDDLFRVGLPWNCLVTRVAPLDKLMSVAITLAEDIVSSAPLSIRRMKNRFRKTYGMPIYSGLRLDAGPDPYSSEDAKEGAKAFLEKRTPV